MHFTRTPLKEKIAQAVYRLETQLSRLEQTSAKLQQRDREMFERCIGAKANNDTAHAVIYANECVEIRNMAKIVLSSQLALEKVILRLQTIEEVGDVMVHMAPVLSIVKETRGNLKGVIPEVSQELDEINIFLNNTFLEVGTTPEHMANLEASSSEAKKVLEEAATIAERKVKEEYPKLPEPPLTAPEPPSPEAEALTVGGSPEPAPFEEEKPVEAAEPPTPIQEVPFEQLKEQVYDFIRECGGELNLSQCAQALNADMESVQKALAKLEEEGRIRVQT